MRLASPLFGSAMRPAQWECRRFALAWLFNDSLNSSIS
jgi:hypothetical protein